MRIEPGLRETLQRHIVLEAVFDAVLDADDTIIFSKDTAALE